MKTLPSARLLTIIPSTRGITMLNFPVAPWIFIRNNPVFKGWMKMTGTSFSRVVDLKKRKHFLPQIVMCNIRLPSDFFSGRFDKSQGVSLLRPLSGGPWWNTPTPDPNPNSNPSLGLGVLNGQKGTKNVLRKPLGTRSGRKGQINLLGELWIGGLSLSSSSL